MSERIHTAARASGTGVAADADHLPGVDDPAGGAALTAAADDARWAAVSARDCEADGEFVFAVATTGVYCRPSCPARRPLRRNVRFFDLPAQARVAGFRPCRRCRPDEMSPRQRAALAVEAACRTLEAAAEPVPLARLAEAAGMSPHHFHRTFSAHTGLTPKAFHEAARVRRAAEALATSPSVTGAAHEAGFASLSRFYDRAAERFGMAPSALGAGGKGEVIVIGRGCSALGVVTVAFSRRGIAAVRLTDGAAEGMDEVARLFGKALVVEGGADFDALVAEVVAAVDEPARAVELPLDIRGTAFEERVWAALRRIPVGTTATYGEIAEALGSRAAHRAVARACGANPIAVLVPCHRVIRADGSLAGYRWGLARKRALIEAEREAVDAGAAVDRRGAPR